MQTARSAGEERHSFVTACHNSHRPALHRGFILRQMLRKRAPSLCAADVAGVIITVYVRGVN